MNDPHFHNGHGPHSHGQFRSHPTQSHKLRIPKVKEALPYTPFGSIVPFDPKLVPPPLADPSTASTAFTDLDDVRIAKKELDELSAGALNAELASKRCQKTLGDVRRLLEAENLPEYKFAKPRRHIGARGGGAAASRNGGPPLSSFAKMVFDYDPVAFRYVSDEEVDHKDANKAIQKNSFPLSKTVQVQVHTPEAGARQSGRPDFQEHSPALPLTSSQAYVVPASMTPAQLAEYQFIPDVERVSGASGSAPVNKQHEHLKRRPVLDAGEQQKSDLVLQNLQNLLLQVSEAEAQLQPEDPEKVLLQANTFISLHDAELGAIPTLQPEIQARLDVALHKVIAANRLDDVEVEHLARVQRLCQNSIVLTQVGALDIGGDWMEQDLADWLSHIAGAQAGLVAARTLVRVVTAGSHRAGLQSEDCITTALDTLQGIVEKCIIPIVEERPFLGEKIRGAGNLPANPKFAIASENSHVLKALVQDLNKFLRALGTLLAGHDIDERALSSIEYTCKLLIFAENATADKDSAMGTQIFEATRKCAMDVFSKIFTKYIDQRQFILQEILMSLEKLPATKQSARQFRLIDAKPIQLVSALLMRLVQTSAIETHDALRLGSKTMRADKDATDSEPGSSIADEDADYDEDEDEIKVSPSRKPSRRAVSESADDLESIVTPLYSSVRFATHYIVTILLQRAITTTKSSEEPFRKLLDIFTDDFLNVLGSSDWPSAEILLRTLVMRLIEIAEKKQSLAPARTLALELLGTIGSGILDAQSAPQAAAAALDAKDPTTLHLVAMANQSVDDQDGSLRLTAFDGPYRVVVEYLQARSVTDPQLQTASGYHLMQWAQLLDEARKAPVGGAEVAPSRELEQQVKGMIQDPQWLAQHTEGTVPTTAQGRLAAKIVAARSPLCRAFDRIFQAILNSMTSEQPTIRSRGLKSVTSLLEKQPSLLDRNSQIIFQLTRCMADSSSLVRDSALTLAEKCVSLRPAFELKLYDRVMNRAKDNAVGVRKRCVKFLKQVYLRNSDGGIRSDIAKVIMERLQDDEPSVAEIARETMEDMWFVALKAPTTSGERSLDVVLQYRAQASLLIQIINAGSVVESIMEGLIRAVLRTSKRAIDNVRVCKALVDVLFDGIIDTSDIPGVPTQSEILRVLTVFARVDSSLFAASQLERLEPYVKNLATFDDLDVFHHAITVLRYTMPRLTAGLGKDFLENLQLALLKAVNVIPPAELVVVAPCLWEIDKVLKNPTRLRNFVASAVDKIHSLRGQDLSARPNVAIKLLTITGQFGNACDFEPQIMELKQRLTWFHDRSVADMLITETLPFTSPKQPLTIRAAALEAVCCICQRYPEQFLRIDVTNAIEMVFKDQVASLEFILLTRLESFFAAQEVQPYEEETSHVINGVANGSQRLDGTYKATEHDKASTSLSQRFLPDFLRLALGSLDECADSAARIVVSVNRQGRTHPRDSGPALVALETSPKSMIANMAFAEHKNQAAKHESVYEKEIMRGVQQAFEYQRDVVGEPSGVTGNPSLSKLHLFWEVLKNGKAKVRTKFFTNLCAKMDFDPARLVLTRETPMHLTFVRFCLDAVAFLDHDRTEEVLQLLTCLEKTFAGTGTLVAQAIESEILRLHMPTAALAENTMIRDQWAETDTTTVDVKRLHQLAVSAQILSLLWETRSFIRRLWNMQKYSGKPKSAARDTNRAPTRSVNAMTLIEGYHSRVNEIMAPLTTEGAQRAMCTAFVELISVDDEVKVGADDDDAGEMDDSFDTRSEGSSSRKSPSTVSGAPRGKKRKSAGSNPMTPRKKSKAGKCSVALEDDNEEVDWM